jgi:hypothetical protein
MKLFLSLILFLILSGCSVRQKIELDSQWKRDINNVNMNYQQCYSVGHSKFNVEMGVRHKPQGIIVNKRNDFRVKTSFEW